MTARSSTRDLVRFGLDTYQLSTLPLSVRSKAVDLLVDQIGLQLACAQYPWSRAVHQYVRRFAAPGRSTIVYHGDETSPEQAAFANAAFGHG